MPALVLGDSSLQSSYTRLSFAWGARGGPLSVPLAFESGIGRASFSGWLDEASIGSVLLVSFLGVGDIVGWEAKLIEEPLPEEAGSMVSNVKVLSVIENAAGAIMARPQHWGLPVVI